MESCFSHEPSSGAAMLWLGCGGERHGRVDRTGWLREGAIKHRYCGILVSPRTQDCHGKASQSRTGQTIAVYQANLEKPLTV